MTAGRRASHGSRRDANGRAARGPALAFTATAVASCRDARLRGPSGHPADRAEPQPVRHAAGLAARAGGYCCFKRSSLRTMFERESNPLHAGFAGCSTYELSNGGRPGSRTRARRRARPFAFVCPWRHALPRRIVFGGGAPARLANLHSRASGTSGAFYLARSVPAGVAAHGTIFKSLNGKGNCLKRARDMKPRRRKALGEIRYNQIASYLVG